MGKSKWILLFTSFIILCVSCGDDEDQVITSNKGIWITSYLGTLWKFSYSGKTIVRQDDVVKDSSDLCVHRATGCCWYVNDDKDTLVKVSSTGEQLETIHASYDSITSIGVNQTDGSLRAICWSPCQVKSFSKQGDSLWDTAFRTAHYLDVYNKDGSCWVSHEPEYSNSCVLTKLDKNGRKVFEIKNQYNDAREVAIDQRNGDCWVRCWNYSIFKYSARGVKLMEFDADPNLRCIAVSERDGSLYLTYGYEPGHLVKYNSSGMKQWDKVLDEAGGNLAVDPINDTIWVCSGYENGLVEYSSDGDKLFAINRTPLFIPCYISLDY